MEITDGFSSDKLDVLSDKRRLAETQNNINKRDMQNDLKSSYNELSEAKQRLRILEMKIQTLESRMSKKYPDVLFLNYKNRKRILVRKQKYQMHKVTIE